ncbi:hypothetical protein LSCM4_02428 [Leishmania orientalis]|uniref:Uncharacterized protein n=1 Tax=Leishmania orientalis TaxID=2249476 RepID=A0A836H308_9TRYP|nr:hypothetical protein LSCM4_02428 [Leishmania orientalis]
MRRYRSWRAAPLLSAFLIDALLFLASCSAATRTRESQLSCLPTEAEPYGLISCFIEVRNEYQEPATSFDPLDFIVLTRTSNAGAVVKKTALVRGSVTTTAFFTLSVSAGADVLIRVYWRERSSIGNNADMREVRGSGTTVSVLPRPASLLGPITCTAPSTGLALRSSTVCRAALYDESNALAAVHSANVFFSEASGLGSFAFMSGTGALVFRFTAPPSVTENVSNFTLKVLLRGKDGKVSTSGAQAVQIPLLYPVEVALARATTLQCAAERQPITCYITASDAHGPVRFNSMHFRVRVERSVEAEAAAAQAQGILAADSPRAAARHWVDVTDTFDLSITSSPLRPYGGIVSVVPKSNTTICETRLRVYASTYGQEMGASSGGKAGVPGNAADVAGSPYSFTKDWLPNAPLRLEVLPVASGSSHNTPAASTDTVLVLVGLLFYGSVLFVGGALIVRRSCKSARIRHERALKQRAMAQRMDTRRGVPTASAEDLTNISTAFNGTPAGEEAAVGASAGCVVVVRGGTDRSAPEYEPIHMLDAGYGETGGVESSSMSLPLAPAAVVSNTAVPQDRLHSDSD